MKVYLSKWVWRRNLLPVASLQDEGWSRGGTHTPSQRSRGTCVPAGGPSGKNRKDGQTQGWQEAAGQGAVARMGQEALRKCPGSGPTPGAGRRKPGGISTGPSIRQMEKNMFFFCWTGIWVNCIPAAATRTDSLSRWQISPLSISATSTEGCEGRAPGLPAETQLFLLRSHFSKSGRWQGDAEQSNYNPFLI